MTIIEIIVLLKKIDIPFILFRITINLDFFYLGVYIPDCMIFYAFVNDEGHIYAII